MKKHFSPLETLVSTNIAECRETLDWTQQRLADRLGVKRSLVGAWEERRACPRLKELLGLASAFGVTVEQLATVRIQAPAFHA